MFTIPSAQDKNAMNDNLSADGGEVVFNTDQ